MARDVVPMLHVDFKRILLEQEINLEKITFTNSN